LVGDDDLVSSIQQLFTTASFDCFFSTLL
jgi:hypothetical protein